MFATFIGSVLRSGASSSKVTFVNEEYRITKRQSEKNSYNSPFWECFRPVLFLIQLTGLMPIQQQPNGMFRFSFASITFLYSIMIASVIFAFSIMSLMKALHDNMEFDKIITFMFYFVDFMVIVQFQFVAAQWSNIMTVWKDFERTLAQNEQLLGKRYSLRVTFQLVLILVTVMTVVSEILSVAAGLEKAQQCVHIDDELQRYFRQAFPQIFLYTEYQTWKAILMQCVQFLCTFVRMLLDIFLVFIGLGLSSLISRLNLQYRLPKSKRTLNDGFWVRYKAQYLQFMDLVTFVDTKIGHVTILCFLSDLYLICVRLLNSLKSMTTVRQALFFWYALLFLIMRLIWVCIVAAQLHEEAKRPLLALRQVLASSWTMEVQRFQDLITHNDVCLSGYGYFKLRRTLLLSVNNQFRINSLIEN